MARGSYDLESRAVMLEARGEASANPRSQVLKSRVSVAPKGPKQESPGQRPGKPGEQPSDKALKGRNNERSSASIASQPLTEVRPKIESPVSPFQGRHFRIRLEFPGRRPGLECFGPFGAEPKTRNFKTHASGWYRCSSRSSHRSRRAEYPG